MPNGSFALERTLILPIGQYDPKKIDLTKIKGSPVLVKAIGKKPIQVGYIRDAFENPREGIYADIVISSKILMEVDADKAPTGTFLNPSA